MARIGRDVLKQFLPNHETIVAFEKLLKFMDDSPSDFEELLALVSSIKRVNVADISARLNSLEVPTPRSGQDARLAARTAELEQMPLQSANLSSILQRLSALEANQARRETQTALNQRITKIENFLGI